MHRAGLFPIFALLLPRRAGLDNSLVPSVHHDIFLPCTLPHRSRPGLLPLALCTVPPYDSRAQTYHNKKDQWGGLYYTLKSLSYSEQGQNSVTYRVVGGFQGVAAIVKIIDPGRSKTISDNAKKEVRILRKSEVRQLRYYEKEKKHSDIYEWTLVMKGIHVKYPQPGNQLAPLYDILEENPHTNVGTAVRKVRALAIKRVEDLAASSHFVYRDIQPLNVFTNRALTVVHFIDYGFPGVVDISSGPLSSSRDARLRAASALRQARENAEDNFTVDTVRHYMHRHSSYSSQWTCECLRKDISSEVKSLSC